MTCMYFNKNFTGLIDFVQLFYDKYSMDILSIIISKSVLMCIKCLVSITCQLYEKKS